MRSNLLPEDLMIADVVNYFLVDPLRMWIAGVILVALGMWCWTWLR